MPANRSPFISRTPPFLASCPSSPRPRSTTPAAASRPKPAGSSPPSPPAPNDGQKAIAALDRCRFYNAGPIPGEPNDPNVDSSYEIYVRLPADPADELQHASTYLEENTPGIDYTEIWPQMEADRAEIEAFQLSMQESIRNNTTPPDTAGLSVDPALAVCHRGLIAYNKPLPPVPA